MSFPVISGATQDPTTIQLTMQPFLILLSYFIFCSKGEMRENKRQDPTIGWSDFFFDLAEDGT